MTSILVLSLLHNYPQPLREARLLIISGSLRQTKLHKVGQWVPDRMRERERERERERLGM